VTQIRVATPADLPAVCAVEREVFGAGAYDPTALRQLLELFPALAMVALADDGGLAGHALGAVAHPEPVGWILSLAVRPARRGAGLGAELGRALLDGFAAAGIARVRLTVAPTNAGALRLYERLGFAVIDELPDYFGPGEPRLRLERRAPGRAR
jgi:ribosomal protein S18 acetylase RimI-like enzyme